MKTYAALFIGLLYFATLIDNGSYHVKNSSRFPSAQSLSTKSLR